jgi:hypothetical protein
MWVFGGEGDGNEKEDITSCFLSFPRFQADFAILVAEGVIKHDAFNQYVWTKSKTSLAEYFKWIGGDAEYVPGGFWAPIETTFRKKRGTLRKLAGQNANPLKPLQSKDFRKIKDAVLRYRAENEGSLSEREAFDAIKRLIDEAPDDEPETIRGTLEKIKKNLSWIVDKKSK